MIARFVINVDGVQRKVLSIKETAQGDLNLHFSSGGKTYSASSLHDLIACCDESRFETSEKHISVHRSLQSDEVNLIKRTVCYSDRKEDMCQITTGIKKDELFVPIVFRVCGDLSRNRFKVIKPLNKKTLSLGSYDPKRDQVRFLAVCSRRGTSFPKDEEHPSNVTEVQFTYFTLTLIWSYFNQPSHPQAIDFFIGTTPENGPIRGLEWYEVYNLYTDFYMVHAMEYFKICEPK